MSFISRAQLESYGRGFAINSDYIRSKQAQATANGKSDAQVTLFLSHSHKDRVLIEPAISFLRSHGVKIYVDWMDEGMPDVLSAETAKKIKEKIGQQKKFLVMVTENSKDSRWVPWELGYADPTKGLEHIASFPIKDGEYDFTQNEYMKIYPKIYCVNNTWYVWRTNRPKSPSLKIG